MESITNYSESIKALKSAILLSRYKAATLVNKELLLLYFAVGKFISEKVKQEKWGAKIIDTLSNDLQTELPGLRGFSATNIKKMRIFFEYWEQYVLISPSVTDQLETIDNQHFEFSPSVTDQLQKVFFNVSFTHHIELLQNKNSIAENSYYIQKIASEFWSVSTLKHHLRNKSFSNSGSLPNNFTKAIKNEEIRNKALQSFKDEYLLDFINIEDQDDQDESVLENGIVRNIRKFLMSLGTDFAFISNQYRLIVEDEEYFLYVKQPHEQPSIGIILCKEKKNKIVEFSFRDFNKAMGVSTYKTSNTLPKALKGLIPDAETFKKLMD